MLTEIDKFRPQYEFMDFDGSGSETLPYAINPGMLRSMPARAELTPEAAAAKQKKQNQLFVRQRQIKRMTHPNRRRRILGIRVLAVDGREGQSRNQKRKNKGKIRLTFKIPFMSLLFSQAYV